MDRVIGSQEWAGFVATIWELGYTFSIHNVSLETPVHNESLLAELGEESERRVGLILVQSRIL